MKIISSDLDRIAVMESQYPKDSLPEIAFAGRSNVGKSSFINSMLNRKNLARTSSKPGKTRTLNFYRVNDAFRMVDLPGYGYARVSKDEKEKWGHIIEEFLTIRDNLKEVVLVVDIRHKPSNDDIIMYDWIRHFGYGSFIIATKLDKLKKSQVSKNLKVIKETLNLESLDMIVPYSSEKMKLDEKVWNRIEEVLNKDE